MASRTRLCLRLRCHGFKGRALKFHSRGGEPGDEVRGRRPHCPPPPPPPPPVPPPMYNSYDNLIWHTRVFYLQGRRKLGGWGGLGSPLFGH